MNISQAGANSNINILHSVNSIMRGKDASIDNAYGFLGGDFVGPVGSQIAYVQLLNPNGSGKVIVVDKIKAWSNTADHVYLNSYATALATAITYLGNKEIGSAAPVGELYKTTSASSLGTILDTFTLGTANMTPLGMDYPIILPANSGIMVRNNTVNYQLEVNFEWREFDA